MSTNTETLRKRFTLSRVGMQQVIITGILGLVLLVMSCLSDRFFSFSNMLTVLRQATLVMIAGCGATLLAIAGHLDLSTGATLAFCGVWYAQLAQKQPLPLAALMCVGFGLLIGLINGFCVTKLKITHFIATMGTMYSVRGFAFIICDGISVNSGLPKNFTNLGRGLLFGVIPYIVLIALGMICLFTFIQKRTKLGKYCCAIGGNRTAAVLSGINADGIVMAVFMIVSALAAFCGVIMSSRLGAGDPNVSTSFHFDVICAFVLGGTSLSGGEGSIVGMATGALIIEFLNNGLNIMGVQSFWQDVVKGFVLVFAVILTRSLERKFKK